MTDDKDSKEGVIIKLLREATSFEIGLVAFLFLPPILLAWIQILDQIIPKENTDTRSGAYITILVIYIVLVSVMVRGKLKTDKQKKDEAENQAQIEREKAEKDRQALEAKLKEEKETNSLRSAKNIILIRLKKLGHDLTSYEKLRKGLHKYEWTDDFFHSVVDTYPNIFAHNQIQGGKPGLKVISWEDQDSKATKPS